MVPSMQSAGPQKGRCSDMVTSLGFLRKSCLLSIRKARKFEHGITFWKVDNLRIYTACGDHCTDLRATQCSEFVKTSGLLRKRRFGSFTNKMGSLCVRL